MDAGGQHDRSSYRLLGTSMGAHSASVDAAGNLFVEWYNFGEDVAYEYVSQMIFDRTRQIELAEALELPEGSLAPDIIDSLATRFRSCIEVSDFVSAHGIAYEKRIDFRP